MPRAMARSGEKIRQVVRKKWKILRNTTRELNFSVRARHGKGLAGRYPHPFEAALDKQSECPQNRLHPPRSWGGLANKVVELRQWACRIRRPRFSPALLPFRPGLAVGSRLGS